MNRLFYVIILIIIVVGILNPQSDQSKNKVELTTQIEELRNQVAEIRRDQLNYKIEKEILKEVYSSNINTINVVITIILGVFAIIGFLGLRDIGSLRKEYASELEKLNRLREDFENKIRIIESEQEKAKDTFTEIVKQNEEQNRRIKILELQEKIASLIRERNHRRALEYIEAALNFDEKNVDILESKGICFYRLLEYENALKVYKEIFAIEENHLTAIVNSAEILLFTNKINEFNDFYGKHKYKIDTHSDGLLLKYFNILKIYLANNLDQLRSEIFEFISGLDKEKEKRMNWDFRDARRFLYRRPDGLAKKYFRAFIDCLEGSVEVSKVREILTEDESNKEAKS